MSSNKHIPIWPCSMSNLHSLPNSKQDVAHHQLETSSLIVGNVPRPPSRHNDEHLGPMLL